MLHQSKSESIIGWFNASTMMKKDTSIQSIAELSDGKKFIVLTSIVMDLKKEILESESNPFYETNNPNPVSMDVKVDDVIDNSETEIDVEENVGMTVELSPEPTKEMVVEKEGNFNQADELEVKTRFEDIKKFIDGFLNQDSSSIIVYPECIKGKELELAKVAVLLLSALAQSYLSFNIELYLNYLIILNTQSLEDIKECMKLIVESDEPLKKTELQKILSRPSKSKYDYEDILPEEERIQKSEIDCLFKMCSFFGRSNDTIGDWNVIDDWIKEEPFQILEESCLYDCSLLYDDTHYEDIDLPELKF